VAEPDPKSSRGAGTLRRFRQAMRWLALFAILVAGAAVALVARGDEGAHLHMMIATALGAGLTVLLAGALMTLAFLSSSGGHDEDAAGGGRGGAQ